MVLAFPIHMIKSFLRLLSFFYLTLLAISLYAGDVPSIDKIYRERIYNVKLYTALEGPQGLSPATTLQQTNPLILEFDDLGEDPQNYYFKIYHCNADWTVSYLNSSQYLYDFNEFRITDREMSYSTRTLYYRHATTLPKVKVSGNYLIKVYRNYDEEDLVLTKRMVIYETICNIVPDIRRSVIPADAFTKQQVNFKVIYNSLMVSNIYQDIKVVVRQNYRWDNLRTNLQATFVRDYEKTLDYDFYNNETAFNGLNEFRYFDMRSVRFNGIYMGKVVRNNDFAEVWLLEESSRKGLTYTFYDDINGAFLPELYETGNRTIEPDYAVVHFKLNAKEPAPGDVYVVGGFNQNLIEERYKMTYDDTLKAYVGSFWMKQGYYNYMYTVVNAGKRDDTYFEGNSSLTENAYDIIVYARVQGELYDRAVGYFQQRFRGR